MGFWFFMFICNILIPLLMIITGRWMWKRCPKKINSILGYRTARSMKNMDTWKFAHEHAGKLWWKSGWIMLIPSIVVQLPFMRSSEDVIGTVGLIICTLQVVIMIVSIIPTEKALKKTFDENGNIKNTLDGNGI